MNYNPQQPHYPYDYQKQIVTSTSAPDISRLTLRQFNDLYPRSSFVEYEQPSYLEQQPYFECPPQPLYVPFGSNNNNMHHHNKLQQSMDHPIRKLCY